MEKYKIVNFKKFFFSILILTALIITISFCIARDSFSYTKIKYKEIEVVQGDTLWNIAEEQQLYNSYCDNKDIREIIELIKQTNNMKTSELIIGQKILVPYM